jgi:hypothetical protein
VPARLLNARVPISALCAISAQFLPFAHLQPLCALPALLPLPPLGKILFTWNPTTKSPGIHHQEQPGEPGEPGEPGAKGVGVGGWGLGLGLGGGGGVKKKQGI